MDTINILTKAREIIATPDKWTRGCSAVDEKDYPVFPASPNACRFCVMGSVEHVAIKSFASPAGPTDIRDGYAAFETGVKALKATLVARGRSPYVSDFNDNERTTHEDVLGP